MIYLFNFLKARTPASRAKLVKKLVSKENSKREKLEKLGIEYKFPGYVSMVLRFTWIVMIIPINFESCSPMFISFLFVGVIVGSWFSSPCIVPHKVSFLSKRSSCGQKSKSFKIVNIFAILHFKTLGLKSLFRRGMMLVADKKIVYIQANFNNQNSRP